MSTPATRLHRRALMTAVTVAGAIIAMILAPSAALGPERSGDPDLLRDVEEVLADGTQGLQTLSVARVRDGRVQFAGLGSAGAAAPGPDTVYELGSITKVFTGMLLADAVERGVMSLDAPISDYLPELVNSPAGGVTPRELATHTSGMPGLVGGGAAVVLDMFRGGDFYAGWSVERFLEAVAATDLEGRGTEQYSNAGVSLLGHAIARASGEESWQEVLRARLLEPLGMEGTRIAAPGTPEDVAEPHAVNGFPQPSWSGEGYAPSGSSTRSTAADLARFAQALLDGSAPGMAALDPHEPGAAHGLGWALLESPGGILTWHNGGTAGSATMLVADRHGAKAAVILGNSSVSLDAAAIGLLVPGVSHEAPGWDAGAVAPLFVSAVLAWSAGSRPARARFGVEFLTGATEGAIAAAIAWHLGPWHLLPAALLGVLPGLAGGAAATNLLSMRGTSFAPERRRVARFLELGFAVLILVAVA